MSNEYLEAFEDLQEKGTFRGEQWFGERQRLVQEYSWAVPNEQTLAYLAEFDRIYEVGAGNGYWAHCIEERGGEVIAYDTEPGEELYSDVREAAVADIMDKIHDEPVLMVWPPYDEDVAATVVEAEPSHLLYVGERRGGCTGDKAFFDALGTDYGMVARIEIPSYAGINDDFYHYVRKI